MDVSAVNLNFFVLLDNQNAACLLRRMSFSIRDSWGAEILIERSSFQLAKDTRPLVQTQLTVASVTGSWLLR